MVLQDTYGNTFPVNNAVLLNNYHSNGPHANQTQFPNSAVLLIAAVAKPGWLPPCVFGPNSSGPAPSRKEW